MIINQIVFNNYKKYNNKFVCSELLMQFFIVFVAKY